MTTATISRRALYLCLCLCLPLAALGCDRTVTLEVSRDEIQKRLASKFPIQKPVLLATITFENPNVILREGSDRIGLELAVRVQAPLLPARAGKLAVAGKPVYRPAEKAFYLQEAVLERFEVDGLSSAEADQLRAPTELVARAVLDAAPVYQLEQRDWKEVSAEHMLKSIKVESGKLYVTLGP